MEESELTLRTEERVKLLERENELLNNIIQGASDSIYAKDLEGRYITINQKGAKFLGLQVDEVIGKTDEELFGEDGRQFMKHDETILGTKETVAYENQMMVNGQERFFWTSKSALEDGTGKQIGHIGISRDITTVRHAQNKYQFLFENAPVGFWEEDFSEVKLFLDELKDSGVTDFRKHFVANPDLVEKCIDKIKILNVNRATLEMNASVDKRKFIQRLRRNFTPESESIFLNEFVALAEGKTFYQSEGSLVTNSGETLDVQFKLNVLPGREEDLSLVLISLIDITESKKMESELSMIRMRYRSIVDEQKEMICRINPLGHVTFGNRAFKKFFSQQDFEKDRVNFFKLFPTKEKERYQKEISELSAANSTCLCELRNYTSEQEFVWQSWSTTAFYSSNGSLIGYQAVGMDVTERRNTEDALSASEARWKSVFQQIDDLVMTVNSTGLILSVNKYKYFPKGTKWAGKHLEDVLIPQNATRATALLNEAFEQKKPINGELKLDNPNGGRHLVFSCTLSPVFSGNRMITVVVMARNITKKKEIEKQTKEALIEGQESERTRVSQELHDGLGQLFTVIKFNLQHLKSGLNKENEYEIGARLNALEENIGTAIKEVKNISRNLMPDVLEQFGLGPALEDLVRTWKDFSDVNISLELIDMDKRFGREVEKAMFRICQELINNAYRHAEPQNVFVQVINHGKSIVLMVEDDGIGYDKNTLKKGFGLKNINSRTELLDGYIDIDTGENCGTVTTIEIPLNKAAK